jgi:hypothetical protein
MKNPNGWLPWLVKPHNKPDITNNPDFLEYLEAKQRANRTMTWKGKALEVWGFTFRVVFIICIGIAAYAWFRPDRNIAEVPIAQLTLKEIVDAILGVIIPLGCLVWLFDRKDDSLSYDEWGKFGITLIIIIIAVIVFLLLRR